MTDAGLDDWVVTNPIPDVVRRVRVIREGVRQDGRVLLAPQPAAVMRILHVFALRRSIDDLLSMDPAATDPAGFGSLDATMVLALAALTRPVGQAAQLAIRQWTKESEQGGERRLTRDLVHDVTAQRIVPEVAEFVSACRQERHADLVEQTLGAFSAPASGRTTLDKAALFIELRARDCHQEADTLLGLTIRDAAAQARAGAPSPGPEDHVGIVGALLHLSPSETIVEDWIARRMEAVHEQAVTTEITADLLVGEPEGALRLAEHIGRTWRPRRLVGLCERLVGRSEERCALVRGYAAARSDAESLSEVITHWYKSASLSGTFRELLADVVARGADRAQGPRTTGFLEDLHQTLHNDAAPERCGSELRVAVAAHVWDRTGAETARLLGLVGRREARRAAHSVNQRLTARLLAAEITAEVFVAYLEALQEQRNASTLTFLALRELSDPAASDHALEGTASVVGRIAAQLYAQGMADVGFDLLERCLENDQWLKAEDVAGIVAHVRLSAMPGDERWDALLSATVGRWSEVRRRDDVVAELRLQQYAEDAEAVIHFVQ